MIWSILPHLTACLAGRDLILLDLRRDRYFRVPARVGGQFSAWLSAADGSPPPEPVSTLLARNQILRARDGVATNLVAVTVSDPLPPLETVPITETIGLAGVAAQVAAAWASLRMRRLEWIIQRRRRWRASLESDCAPVPPGLLAQYRRARRFIPIRQNCVLDSLALDQWLGERGPPRHLVFGVSAEPFLAHCWLQAGSTLLNDSYDHVRRYTPILTA